MENTPLDSFDDFFGNASQETKTKKKFLYSRKIGDEPVTVRFLPPIKSQRKTGRFMVKGRIHYGYYRTNKTEVNGKPWLATFKCIQEMDFKTRMITKECPACTKEEDLKAQLESLRLDITNKVMANPGAKEQDVKTALFKDEMFVMLTNECKNFNADNKWYAAVKFLDGTFGTVKLPTSLRTEIDQVIKKLGKNAEGQDIAIAPKDGVFITLSRFKDEHDRTKYKAEVFQEEVMIDGEAMSRRKKAPLLPTDLPQIERECVDLVYAHGAAILDYDQIKTIVDEGVGNTEVVDAIWNTVTFMNVVDDDSTAEPTVAAKAPVPTKAPGRKNELGEAMESFRKGMPGRTLNDELLESLKDV